MDETEKTHLSRRAFLKLMGVAAAVASAVAVLFRPVWAGTVGKEASESRPGASADPTRTKTRQLPRPRFTERARRALFFAQEEAARLGDNYVGTEHLLLSLVRGGDSVAIRVLDRLGVSLERIRADLERQLTHGHGDPGLDMQLTPRARRVINLTYEEARQRGDNYIGTEHLLLGLIREGDSLAARVLLRLGVGLKRARAAAGHLRSGR